MIIKLGNYSLLTGLLCLVIFFSPSAILVDQTCFLPGGIDFNAPGLLIKRRKKTKKVAGEIISNPPKKERGRDL